MRQVFVAGLALACAALSPAAARAQDFQEFSSRGLPGSGGLVVRVSHPAGWKHVAVDDELALAELRGRHGSLTGILQVGRGHRRSDMASACHPGRAPSMLQGVTAQDPDARVLDVVAREHQGRPAYDIRYERRDAPGFLLVRSLIVCWEDSKVLVSCGAAGPSRAALAAIEPVCGRVLESVRLSGE